MTKEHLIPKDLSKRPDHKELSAKGGRSKSPSKALSSRINGLLQKPDLAPEQRYMLALLKEKQFVDVILELISMNIEEVENPKRRDKVIDQLLKFVPSQSLNVELREPDEKNTCIKCGGQAIYPEYLAEIYEEYHGKKEK